MVKVRTFFNIILRDAINELKILAPKTNIVYNSVIWDYNEMLNEFLLLDHFNNFISMDETGDAKKDPEKLKLEFDANFISRIFKATLQEASMAPPCEVLKKMLQCFRAREKERAVIYDNNLKEKCMYFENAVENLDKRLKYIQSIYFYKWDATLKQIMADDDNTYLTIKYFRNWHNSQREMQVIQYKRQVKKQKQKIKMFEDRSAKEKSVDQTIIEFNKQKLEDNRNEAFNTAKRLTEEQDIIQKKMLAIKYEIQNLRQNSEALTEMMELRQKKMDEFLQYKAEVQEKQKEELLERENNFRIKQARKHSRVSDNVSTTSKKQKPKKWRSKRSVA